MTVVAALVTVVASTACQGSGAAPGASAPPPLMTSTPTPTAPESSTPPTPSTTPSAPPKPVTLKRFDAGTVTNTKSSTVSGSGPADLRFTTKGQFAVVVNFDCSRCRGAVKLSTPGRMTPYARGTAPIEATYLTAVFKNDSPKQSMQLSASGRWKVTFRSWNDLPVETGKQSGTGSTVIALGDRAKKLKVTYKPAGVGDSFNGRLFTVSDQPLVFGGDEPLNETYDVDLPGVIAIQTRGSWTLTPGD